MGLPRPEVRATHRLIEVDLRGQRRGITDPEVDVRVVVRDHGRVVFDTTRLVQLDEWQPNGPGCDPTFFKAGVQATPEGDLIQQ
jgi:hypothetical protein